LILAMFIFIGSANAFFVGFGSAGGVEQVIKKGQEQGVISKIPGETTPGGGETTPGPVQHGAEVVWQKTWDDGIQRTDYAKGIAVDKYGNVYVTGYYQHYWPTYDDEWWYTVKYNSNGNFIWEKKDWIGTGYHNNYAQCISVDDTGNVYVAGYAYNGTTYEEDYLIAKYNSSGGTVWNLFYDHSYDKDYAKGIAVDKYGNVYVTGGSYDGTAWHCLITKYGTNGNLMWQKDNGDSTYAKGIAVDKYGNVYVTGHITDNCLTIKYDTNGNKIWQEKYDSGWYECGCGITVDDTGNVYVTGSSVTIKYNSIGDTVWQKNNSGYGIAVDSSGNVYVTGTSNEDYLTIKYNGTNGDTIWQKVYNGGNADYSQGIAVDSSGNVYVTGYSWNGTDCDYLTIKYRQY